MPGAAFALGLGMVLLIPLIVIALARIEEIAAIAFGRKPLRLVAAPPLVPRDAARRKSRSTFRPTTSRRRCSSRRSMRSRGSTIRISNAWSSSTTRPIRRCGCRSRSIAARSASASNSSTPTTSHGFKAGALRLALAHTAADAEIIGVIDADYVVQPDWLKDLVPLFADPTVGLVQAPQDHRDGERSVMHHAMNGEYAGFFDIGMVQRNEYNAIIVHGTMCLIRRAALEAAGGWSSDTICEDTDLGLTLLELGWQAHYTNKRYGHGLLPDSFEAYKKQRHRWAYGGFQILEEALAPFPARREPPDPRPEARIRARLAQLARRRKHRRRRSRILNIIWVPVVAFLDIAVPDRILTMPIIASFVVSVAAFRRRSTACACASAQGPAARRRCLPPCRCNGRWRARSASA